MRLFFVFSLMFLGVLFLPNFLFNFPGYIEGICCENSEECIDVISACQENPPGTPPKRSCDCVWKTVGENGCDTGTPPQNTCVISGGSAGDICHLDWTGKEYYWGEWSECKKDTTGVTQNCYQTRYCDGYWNLYQINKCTCPAEGGGGGSNPLVCPAGTVKERVYSCRSAPGAGWKLSTGCEAAGKVCTGTQVCVSKLECKCPSGKQMEVYPPAGCVAGSTCPSGYTDWPGLSNLCTRLLGGIRDPYSYCFRCVSNTAPQVDLKANDLNGPVSLDAPASYVVSWTLKGGIPTSCQASGNWNGARDIGGGTQNFSNIAKSIKTYALKCENQYGSDSDSVVVNIDQEVLPTVDIKADGSDGPLDLVAPADYTLSWTSTNAVGQCTASGTGWSGQKQLEDSAQRNDISQGSRTYTITCSNKYDSDSDSVTVNVGSANIPPPPPGEASISDFRITNFRLQETADGVNYYQVLKEQMAVQHANYQLNLVWTVAGADSCTASCKYVKIDDYLANQDFDDLTAQPWPCAKDINGDTTFSGNIDPESGVAKTKPQEAGVLRYRLSCEAPLGSDTADLLVVVQDVKWFETIPILNLRVPGVWWANISGWFNNLDFRGFKVGLAK